MPPRVNIDKCNGCRGKDEPLCVSICPGDLMAIDEQTGKAYCRAARDCWDCMCCTRICPRGAIETRIPYQLGYYPAKLIPRTGKDRMEWTSVDLNGKTEHFSHQTRIKS